MTNGTKLTGLWKKEDKSGKTYFSGSFSPTARMVIFENGYKSKESDPDYYVYIVPVEAKDDAKAVKDDSKTIVAPQGFSARKKTA